MNTSGNDTQQRFTLLLVDDDPRVVASLRRTLRSDRWQILGSNNGAEALELLAHRSVDAAVVDLKMPKMDGMTLLEHLRDKYPAVQVIILTGHGGVEEAVMALKKGAVDFLEKPWPSETLRARIGQLHRVWELELENESLRKQVHDRFSYPELIGTSRPILDLKALVAQVGPSDASVLINGETGTGKELVARAIHHHSNRVDAVFIPVDCAAISETVIESELFGHVKGAFTGANETTLGLIRAADGGTLFLDEVGELTPAIQAKLLRTLQQREVRPVGGSKPHAVDIRIIAATNRDLKDEVAQGNFREDLYYRLNVIGLKAPALRERGNDVLLLARHFIKRYQPVSSDHASISSQAARSLEAYDWPGNVRQLENVIQRALAISGSPAIHRRICRPKLRA